MPLVETLTVTVGGAVSRSLLKLWLRDQGLAQAIGVSISDLAEAKAKTFLEKRSIERSFDRIAEEIALKLGPYIEAEFRNIDEGEVNAAIIASQETIDKAKINEELLLANDLEPIRLEKAIRAGNPKGAKESHLSADGQAIYDFILRESSNYIVEVVSTLPNFQSRATREMLERESTLTELVEKVLDRLPDEVGTGVGETAQFEAQYRREIARKLDRLELFGVTTDELNRRYALSVAYISLTASTTSAGSASRTKSFEAREEEEQTEMSVEALVAQGRRSLIRGEAGSGKTTLLQWLAVSSARRRFDGQLSDWNDTVPFFIQLRRYVDTDLPKPSDFPAAINRVLSEQMPKGWVADQLEQGRGLVLIDGVDELRDDEREAAAEWLRDLIHMYPDCRYVVTSRPPAVSEDWLDADAFSTAFLEPMNVNAIDAFIEHWHQAAQRKAGDEEEVEELGNLAERLRGLVRSAPQIRNLATSPLLCAMLCALNRDRKAQLPNDRVELYRVALEMLLERRDRSREVKSDELQMSRQQKEVLLQGIAYWLLINGFSDASRDDIQHRLEDRIESMPRLDASAEAVLQHLLLRSGLLREPIEGRVDFIHRTFQEYLTAKQTVDDRSTGLLVEHAPEDQWQEVVVLAAGLGTEKFSRELIEALLVRGQAEPHLRHRLHLLAVACLETTPALPKELQDAINEVLKSLIPPRTMSEAKAIASAGNVAIPLLAAHHQGPVATAAPSARALGLIGGPAAMAALEKFGDDSRVTVGRELVRSWDFFPIEEFASRVLANSVLDHGQLTVNNAEKVGAIRHIQRITHLNCMTARATATESWDWSGIQTLSSLRSLRLSGLRGLVELPTLPEDGATLRQLWIEDCPTLEEAAIGGANELTRLHLSDNPSLVELPGIRTLPRLKQIDIWNCKGVGNLRMPASLRKAILHNLPIRDLSLFGDCSLETLRVRACDDLQTLDELAGMDELEEVELSQCPSIVHAEAIFEAPGLKSLDLEASPNIDYMGLEKAKNLRTLDLSMTRFSDLAPLGELTGLESLLLDGCDQVEDLAPIRNFENLTDLSLIECSSVRSIEPLKGIHSLKRLDLFGCRSVESLEPLIELPNLEWVDLRGCPTSFDPQRLVDRGVRLFGRAELTLRPR